MSNQSMTVTDVEENLCQSSHDLLQFLFGALLKRHLFIKTEVMDGLWMDDPLYGEVTSYNFFLGHTLLFAF